MPREVNAPRVYESPLPTRSLSSNPPAGQPSYSLQAHVSPSVPSNSLNRSGSIPYAKPGSSGSRNGPPAGYQNATVTKGSALRHSMKPRSVVALSILLAFRLTGLPPDTLLDFRSYQTISNGCSHRWERPPWFDTFDPAQ